MESFKLLEAISGLELQLLSEFHLIGEASCPLSTGALGHAVGHIEVLSLDVSRQKCDVRMG